MGILYVVSNCMKKIALPSNQLEFNLLWKLPDNYLYILYFDIYYY